ncbi:hypothetical protein BDN72DRAFT_141675 [Pluteus cervinus]|uniref:Uncharacterized protein n=1 Tax=Pluteus cervinus TaxID=181527 RepID=A0ACD3ALM2_9AGAR|nr:hypothetical protein BDN72DRAFT_141675 [Pluteus cervinus]
MIVVLDTWLRKIRKKPNQDLRKPLTSEYSVYPTGFTVREWNPFRYGKGWSNCKFVKCRTSYGSSISLWYPFSAELASEMALDRGFILVLFLMCLLSFASTLRMRSSSSTLWPVIFERGTAIIFTATV